MTERAKKLLLLYYKQSRKIRRVSGLPPLTFKAKKAGTFKNYRIYGQTVDGESVGDKTENLFDETNGVVTDIYIKFDGTTSIGANGDRFKCNRINVIPNTEYTVSWQQMVLGTPNNSPFIRVSSYDDNNNFIIRELIQASQWLNKIYTITTANNAAYLDIRIDDASSKRGQHLEEVMLNAGSDALPYEPYGYKIPVTLTADSAETTDIYLDEPLAKSGNNADYIDYATQKRHNSDGTESSITLPAISTLAGTNTLTVGTEVQPSSVEIKGRIKAAGGD